MTKYKWPNICHAPFSIHLEYLPFPFILISFIIPNHLMCFHFSWCTHWHHRTTHILLTPRVFLCLTNPFNFFMYLSKKNIQWQETTPTNSTSLTRWIRIWTCKSMKLVGSSFSNIQTISTISWRHCRMLDIWISFDVIQRTYVDNLDMAHHRSLGNSWFTHPCTSKG